MATQGAEEVGVAEGLDGRCGRSSAPSARATKAAAKAPAKRSDQGRRPSRRRRAGSAGGTTRKK